MKASIATWLASVALLGGAARAQEQGAVPASSHTAQTTQTARTPAEKLAELIERFNKHQNDTYAAIDEARTQEDKDKAWAKRPGKEYLPEFRAIAEESRGTQTAAKAWLWVLRLIEDDPEQAWEVVELLLDQHMESPAMDELSGELRYATHVYGEARVVDALRSIVAGSPHERVRAGSLFTLGAVLLESEEAERKAEGRDCFEAVIEEYGQHPYRGSSTYKVAAEGFLYELDNLQIGMSAPDFETVDENGAKWRLSDYRGKVVVVDFWGFW